LVHEKSVELLIEQFRDKTRGESHWYQ